MVDQAAMFAVIEFSNDARVVVGLSHGSKVEDWPTLEASGGTDYTSAFRMLRKQLEIDNQMLKNDGWSLFRPCVVFITDGEPTGDASERATAFAELTDPNFPRHPDMTVFGVGEVKPDILQEYVAGKGTVFVTRDGADAGEALRCMVSKLMQSVITSVNTLSPGDDEAPPPTGILVFEREDPIEELAT
jgi:uncharacterized protein YegL